MFALVSSVGEIPVTTGWARLPDTWYPRHELIACQCHADRVQNFSILLAPTRKEKHCRAKDAKRGLGEAGSDECGIANFQSALPHVSRDHSLWPFKTVENTMQSSLR